MQGCGEIIVAGPIDLEFYLDPQFLELLRLDLAGCFGHQVARLLRLGEGDHSRMLSRPPKSITQRSMPSAMPPCGGAPNLQRVEQEAEALFGRCSSMPSRPKTPACWTLGRGSESCRRRLR